MICNLALIVDCPSGWSKHFRKKDSLEPSCQKKESCSLRDVNLKLHSVKYLGQFHMGFAGSSHCPELNTTTEVLLHKV